MAPAETDPSRTIPFKPTPRHTLKHYEPLRYKMVRETASAKKKRQEAEAEAARIAAAEAEEKRVAADAEKIAAAAEKKKKQRQQIAVRMAAKAALRKDLGERAFRLLPTSVLEIETYTFDYHGVMPDTGPELTVWALMRALKGASVKGLEAVTEEEPRILEIRSKKSKDSLQAEPYKMNFSSGQNCDAMLRHLYGIEFDTTEQCAKCSKGNGALVGCVAVAGVASCGNCDWNRSGAACSFTISKKRKATEDAEDSSEGNDTDPFEDLDRKTCQKLAQIFKAATDRKKHKKSA